ncbi:MAG: molybdenum cofactor guanylyltransferase [Acidaminobacteraceae bacterium]
MENTKFEKKLKTAVILAGGRSTRMGFDKQLIKIDDRFLIEILVEKLSREFDEIIIISNDHSVYSNMNFECKVIIEKDMITGKGPLCGLYSALYHSSSEYIFLMACDMPYINLDYIKYLKLEILRNKRVLGIVSEKGKWIEPFYGFYSKDLMTDILKNIENDDLKILNLLLKNEIIYVKESKVRLYSKNLSIFENLNTIEDIERYKLSRLFHA